jgi:hypothetical protein
MLFCILKVSTKNLHSELANVNEDLYLQFLQENAKGVASSLQPER